MSAILSVEPTLLLREFEAFRALIYELAGIVLSDAKQTLVQSRLARRMRELRLTDYADYLQILTLDRNSQEITNFINALTTNKTDFFREPFHFNYLTQQLLPEIEARGCASGDRKLRIWCAASSTGEEPYSLAMTVREYFGQDSSWDLRILASDIDTNVLATASAGIYPDSRVADIPVTLRHRYFERERTGGEPRWRALPAIRDLLTFRRINLKAREWPINTLFDVIFCRNVMIYFDRDTQSELLTHFADYLRPDGILMVGHSESLHDLTIDFQSLGNTMHRCIRTTNPTEQGPGETTQHGAARVIIHQLCIPLGGCGRHG